MAKIDSATLEVINDYYKQKEIKIIELQNKIKEKNEEELTIKFDLDEDVKVIRGLFHKLRNNYGSYNLNLCCELYKYRNDTSYKENERWIQYEEELKKLKKERSLLIAELECNPKNSTEYKEAYKKLQKLFK